MNHFQSLSKKAHHKRIFGVLLIGFSFTSVLWFLDMMGDNAARYDCYVWGFHHAVCRSGQTVENYSGESRCIEHIKPVPICNDFPETQWGMSDAMRLINGEPVESPPSNLDYRTFHVNF